jgi:WD40 repeat protein
MSAILPTTVQHTLKTHTAPINAITFSSQQGTYILTGSSDRQIHLSRSEPNTSNTTTPPVTTFPIQRYTSHGYPVLSITISTNNNTFASSGGDRSVFLWDVNVPDTTTRRLGSNTSQSHTSRINAVTYAADDGVIVSGSDDRSVRIWDLKSRDAKPITVLEDAKDGISSLVVPDGGVEIVSGSTDGRVRCYDIRMGRITTDTFAGPVTSLDVSRDGKLMLVGCLDGRLRIMDRSDGTCLRVFPGEEGGDGFVNKDLRLKSCFVGDERLVVSGTEGSGSVWAYDVMEGKLVEKFDVGGYGKVVSVVAWREESRIEGRKGLWAAGGAEGVVRVFGNGEEG